MCAFIFRNPLTTQIVAAGEGQGDGESVIEVGIVEGRQLGFTQPRSVSFVGDEQTKANNEIVETAIPQAASDSEVVPSTSKQLTKTKSRETNRPTANQTEQLITPKPLRGSSADTSVEVGRSFGSPAPAISGGVGVGSGASQGLGGVSGGSEYGRRIQIILSRNYNPPSINDVAGPQYVIVQLRIARDGRVLSLINGRLSPGYIKKRSSNDLINYAAERAVIASNPLPPFPNGFLMGAQEAVAEIWFKYPK